MSSLRLTVAKDRKADDDDDDDDVQEQGVVPVSRRSSVAAASSSFTPLCGSGKSTRGFPNITDDAPVFQGRETQLFRCELLVHAHLKEQLKVTYADPNVAR